MQGLDTLLPKTNGYKSRRLWYPIMVSQKSGK